MDTLKVKTANSDFPVIIEFAHVKILEENNPPLFESVMSGVFDMEKVNAYLKRYLEAPHPEQRYGRN